MVIRWVYRITDLEGNVLHEGTARELSERGLYSSERAVGQRYRSNLRLEAARRKELWSRRHETPEEHKSAVTLRRAAAVSRRCAWLDKLPEAALGPAMPSLRDELALDIWLLEHLNRAFEREGGRRLSYGAARQAGWLRRTPNGHALLGGRSTAPESVRRQLRWCLLRLSAERQAQHAAQLTPAPMESAPAQAS